MMSSPSGRNVLQDISVTPMRGSDSDSNVVFMSESYLTPSPEEQVIRSRRRPLLHTVIQYPDYQTGRVCLTCGHDPNVQQCSDVVGNCLFQATPEKPGLQPVSRKRLLLTPPDDNTYRDNKKQKQQKKTNQVPLATQLHGYATPQLVDVIDRLVYLYPQLEQDIRSCLPKPDLRPLEERLVYLKKSVYRALPSFRWVSSRDAHCYKRVKLHLDAFKKACLAQGRVLCLAQCWEAVISYTIMAYKYIEQLPEWDEPAHNRIKQRCFRGLATYCMIAIQHGGFDRDQYCDIKKRLEAGCRLRPEIQPCIQNIEKILAETVNC